MKTKLAALIGTLVLTSSAMGVEYESFKGKSYRFTGSEWVQLIDGVEISNPMGPIIVSFSKDMEDKDILDLVEYYKCEQTYVSLAGLHLVAPSTLEDEIKTANALYIDSHVVDVWVDDIPKLYSIPNDPGFLPDVTDSRPWHGQWDLYTDLSYHYPTRLPYADFLGSEAETAWDDIGWENTNPVYSPIIAI